MLTNGSNSFGLTERDYHTITDILVKHPEVSEVHIFGSRAKGNQKPYSDIDLAVINEGVAEPIILLIKSELADSTLPYKVDLINLPALAHTDLREHILRVGLLFYKRDH